jgi:hypothetical protein
MSSTIVAIRLFKAEDSTENWKSVSIIGYLPVFLSGNDNVENVNKRVHMLYLRNQTTYIKLRWHYKENEEDGYWLE